MKIEVRTNVRACFTDGQPTNVVEVVIGGVVFITACDSKEKAIDLSLRTACVLGMSRDVEVK